MPRIAVQKEHWVPWLEMRKKGLGTRCRAEMGRKGGKTSDTTELSEIRVKAILRSLQRGRCIVQFAPRCPAASLCALNSRRSTTSGF